MTPKDWFGLGLRFVGLWCGLQCAQNVMGFLEIKLKLGASRVTSLYGEQVINPENYLPYIIGYLVLAVLLVTRAEFFVRVSFQSSQPTEPIDAESNQNHPSNPT